MSDFFRDFDWLRDVIDILIVWYVIYRMILLVRGTRAAQMLIGLAVVVGAYIISQRLELITLSWILDNLLSSIVLIIIVIFQHDIRRALSQFGRNPFWGKKGGSREASLVEELVKAGVSLANKRIGALIALGRKTGLNDYLESGVQIDAQVVKELIISIFLPYSPIHDGAVIIQEGRIVAAGCFLPLTVNPNVSKEMGTRHRAAIGLSEETDALVIVVSEETGRISLAIEGAIITNLDGPSLREKLYQEFVNPQK
ncbi:MAG: diadenylate cyclase CdaA [Proteobacteria bacterium]|nr:diadenylate cyclase CdaA [Pseudomonadota bacterium]